MANDYGDQVYVPGQGRPEPTRDVEPFWPPDEIVADRRDETGLAQGGSAQPTRPDAAPRVAPPPRFDGPPAVPGPVAPVAAQPVAGRPDGTVPVPGPAYTGASAARPAADATPPVALDQPFALDVPFQVGPEPTPPAPTRAAPVHGGPARSVHGGPVESEPVAPRPPAQPWAEPTAGPAAQPPAPHPAPTTPGPQSPAPHSTPPAPQARSAHDPAEPAPHAPTSPWAQPPQRPVAPQQTSAGPPAHGQAHPPTPPAVQPYPPQQPGPQAEPHPGPSRPTSPQPGPGYPVSPTPGPTHPAPPPPGPTRPGPQHPGPTHPPSPHPPGPAHPAQASYAAPPQAGAAQQPQPAAQPPAEPHPGVTGLPGDEAAGVYPVPTHVPPPHSEPIWTPDSFVPTAEEFARRRAARPADPIATMGVRAALNKTTLGLVRLAPGRHEQEIKQDIEMVRRNFGGLRQVTVVNPKGGAGKTVAILLLAMTFGQKRGGYVLAWDNNETQGTLGMRAQQDFHSRTVRDMLRDLGQFQGSQGRVGDLSQYVRSQSEGMFDVLASDESATAGEMLTATAFAEIREVVSRFYKLIFVDTGNNVRAQNWQAAIDATDQLVVTMSARNDSAETAARMLDHLEQSGRQRLVRQAVTVVSMPPSRREIDLPPIERHFAARTRTVLLAPYERLIDTGEPIRYGQLSSGTRDAWLKIAAAVAEGL
ncbi:chromosome partitioning protein [Micromonospora sp. NPDC049679]|uniref:MinD/ParA family ATP-binding protein n=1 Tax=Micromonospora sp. NPDC049679 TaxID=3155920 RepID=UPI0033E94010